MDSDISALLQSWPHDGEHAENNFRRLTAKNGRSIIQVREPLGIQQLDYDGRPDGQRPHGKTTWLEYYEERSEADPLFTLSHEDCLQLMQEGILFYQRYLILYQMADWEGVARDTRRNIAYFDFTRQHAENREDSLTIEQYRPYILRMNSIARGHLLWKAERFDEAIGLLESTAATIRELESIESPVFKMEQEKSTGHLAEVIEAFKKMRPESDLERLRRRKREAVLSEDFEIAARLRDEIRLLEGHGASKN